MIFSSLFPWPTWSLFANGQVVKSVTLDRWQPKWIETVECPAAMQLMKQGCVSSSPYCCCGGHFLDLFIAGLGFVEMAAISLCVFSLGFFCFCALSMSTCCDGPRHSHCVWHSLRSKKLATALETTTTFTTFQRFGPVFVPIGFQRMWLMIFSQLSKPQGSSATEGGR